MKRSLLMLSIVAIVLSSCRKKSSNTVTTAALPTYTIDGIHDVYVAFNSPALSKIAMPISVDFRDSSQKVVSLSLSNPPAGIAMDTTWTTTGYSTFSTALKLYDTAKSAYAAAGSYPMTLTAKGSQGTQIFNFKIIVVPETSCSDALAGDNYSGLDFTSANLPYSDTVTIDAVTTNKIWFNNFGNTHKKVYAMVNCETSVLTEPEQIINGASHTGKGTILINENGKYIDMDYGIGGSIGRFRIIGPL